MAKKAVLQKNPLLDHAATLHGFPNYRKIRPSHFLPAIRHSIREGRTLIRGVRASSDPPNFSNTIEPLEIATSGVHQLTNCFEFYSELINGPKIKKLAPEIVGHVESFKSALYSDPTISARVSEIYESMDQSDYTSEERQLIACHYNGFFIHGTFLRPGKQRKLKFLNTEIYRMGHTYLVNLINKSGRDLMEANEPVAHQILSLRHQKAQVLGFKTFADLVNISMMAGSTQNALGLVGGYYNSLKELKHAVKEKGNHYPLPEGHEEYFPLEQVFEGMLRHIESFVGIRFVKTERKYPVHHPHVHVYEVNDKETGRLLGIQGVDLYNHDTVNKSGTMAFELRARSVIDGKVSIPITYVSYGYEYPKEGTQNLLRFDEYIELFHEFGHSLQSLLTTGRYPSINGIKVDNDFSEVASQLQEHWARRPDVIRSVARHYKTGEPLDIKSIEMLIKHDAFAGIEERFIRCFHSILDLAIHNRDPKTIGSFLEFENEILRTMGLEENTSESYTIPSFWHGFAPNGDYAACYHAYPASEIIAADIYAEYERQDRLGSKFGKGFKKRIRQTIYELAASKTSQEVFSDLMSRAPDIKSLFNIMAENLGIKTQDNSPALAVANTQEAAVSELKFQPS